MVSYSQNVSKRGDCQRFHVGQCLKSRLCFSKSSFPVQVSIGTHMKIYWKKNYWSFLLLDFWVKIEVIHKLTWFLASSCPPQREATGSHHEELSPCLVKCVHAAGKETIHDPNLSLFFPLGGKNTSAFSSVEGSKATYMHMNTLGSNLRLWSLLCY